MQIWPGGLASFHDVGYGIGHGLCIRASRVVNLEHVSDKANQPLDHGALIVLLNVIQPFPCSFIALTKFVEIVVCYPSLSMHAVVLILREGVLFGIIHEDD